ncbi:MAG: addiction module protein [Verrucomicrobiota bacterium]|nr:addiction module protein [Verrucomicrobiota bacterium]
MNATVDLRQMSLPEKLRLMEDLWSELSQNERDVPSPEWHGAVLAERERKLATGEDTLLDWEAAKHQLRAKLQ